MIEIPVKIKQNPEVLYYSFLFKGLFPIFYFSVMAPSPKGQLQVLVVTP